MKLIENKHNKSFSKNVKRDPILYSAETFFKSIQNKSLTELSDSDWQTLTEITTSALAFVNNITSSNINIADEFKVSPMILADEFKISPMILADEFMVSPMYLENELSKGIEAAAAAADINLSPSDIIAGFDNASSARQIGVNFTN